MKYNGPADGYLLILTNKKRSPSTIPVVDEVIVAAVYVLKGQKIAVSDQNFEILNEQGHIAEDRLREDKSGYGPESLPYTRSSK